MGIAHKNPLYVVKIDKDDNQIVLGERRDLKVTSLVAENVNWISIERLDKPRRFKTKIRYTHKAAGALVKPLDKTGASVEFDEPQEAITTGQAVVFYERDIVVGGGWIK